jgi:gas vesicle protein
MMEHGHWREAFDEVSGAIQALARLQGGIEEDLKTLKETVMDLAGKISESNNPEESVVEPEPEPLEAVPRKEKKSIKDIIFPTEE